MCSSGRTLIGRLHIRDDAAWLAELLIDLEAGERWPNWETFDWICKLYGVAASRGRSRRVALVGRHGVTSESDHQSQPD